MLDFVTIGEVLIDLVGDKELSKAEIFRKCFGGAPANFAIGVSRLGAKVGFVGRVGNDFFGRFLLNNLRKEKVDLSHLKISKKNTPLAFASKGKYFFYHGADLQLNRHDVKEEYVKSSKAFHFSGFTLMNKNPREAARKAFNIAKKNGLLTSFTPNYRETWSTEEARNVIEEFLQVNVLILSGDEAKLLTGKSQIKESTKSLTKNGAEKIVVTLGDKGALAYDGKNFKRINAYKVVVKDVTGAGDAFSSGLMFSLSRGADFFEAVKVGNICGAFAVSKIGAAQALPSLAELKSFEVNLNRKFR